MVGQAGIGDVAHLTLHQVSQSKQLVDRASGSDEIVGEVHPDDAAAVGPGQEPGRAADAASGLEYACLWRDRNAVGERLAGGETAGVDLVDEG